MRKKKVLRAVKTLAAAMLSLAVTVTGLPGFVPGSSDTEAYAAAKSVNRVSVHDPSVVDGNNGYYYIFGSHRAFAKTTDLCTWTTFSNNICTDYDTIFASNAAWASLNNSSYALKDNLWAPDVIYNKTMGKWCMYMSINGANFNSSIAMCTADNIEGPYTYAGTVVYSGFTNSTYPVSQTDYYKVCGEGASISRYLTSSGKWNHLYGTNAIDPCVFYDQNGKLWMVYGSWFGGIFTLKLDEKTGLRDYNTTYVLDTDASDGKASDPYLGSRIAGGMGASGEAPYIQKIGSYYYLFVTYGGLDSNGGYNMRVFRSKHLNGPYKDAAGNYATYTSAVGINNTYGTTGIRLMSYYKFNCQNQGQIAQGHNSVLYDDDGKIFNVYHTRFDDGYEFHEVRVHQMFLNQDNWLVTAPFEYAGETISSTGYSKSSVVGSYEFVIQEPGLLTDNDAATGGYNVLTTSTINLNSDGTITGAITGTWGMTSGTPYVTISYDGVTYKGVFLKQYDESDSKTERMTFSVVGRNNVCMWGAKGTGALNYTEADIEDGVYYIKNVNSGLYMDVENGSTANGANIRQWSYNGCDAQKFKIQSLGNGYYSILTGATGYTSGVDVTAGGFENGVNIEQWEYWGGDMQQFKIVKNADGSYSFLTKVSSGTQAVEVYNFGTSEGDNVSQWAYWGGAAQSWTLEKVSVGYEGTYYIQSVSSGLYWDIEDGSSANGANLRQWYYNGSHAQKFKLVSTGDGYYSILTGATNYTGCVDIVNGSGSNGTNAAQWEYWGGDMQQFKVVKNSDGTFSFLTKVSGDASALEVYDFSTEAGGNIDQWEYWGGDIQKFKLISAE